MIILVSGHSCSGKTLMSQNLLEKYKIPYYSVDHIKMGLYRSDPNCGFTPMDSNEHIGQILWPMIKSIIMTAIENNQSLIIEGCYLLPEFLTDLEADYLAHVLPVFLVFSDAYINNYYEKNIIGYRSIIESRNDPEERLKESFVTEHQKFKSSCEAYQVPYFEIKEDYDKEISKVYDYIELKVNLEV